MAYLACLISRSSLVQIQPPLPLRIEVRSMPHDRKGRMVEVGDHVRFEVSETYDYALSAWKKRLTIGRVVSVTPGEGTCNVQAVHLVPGYWPIRMETITAKETDVALKADGTEPGAGADPTAQGA